MCLYIYIQVSEGEIQTPTHRNLIRRLCYHPTVFFYHLRVIVLSFPQGNVKCAYIKCCYFGFCTSFDIA